jgi:hypothetical protein
MVHSQQETSLIRRLSWTIVVVTYLVACYGAFITLLSLTFTKPPETESFRSGNYGMLQLALPNWVFGTIVAIGLASWIICILPRLPYQKWAILLVVATAVGAGAKLGPTVLFQFPLLGLCLFLPPLGAIALATRPWPVVWHRASAISAIVALLLTGPLTLYAVRPPEPASVKLPTVAFSKINEQSPMVTDQTMTFASPACPLCRKKIGNVHGVIKFASLSKSPEEAEAIDLAIIAYQRGDNKAWELLWTEDPLIVRANLARQHLRPTKDELKQSAQKRVADRALAQALEVTALPTQFDCRDGTCRR